MYRRAVRDRCDGGGVRAGGRSVYDRRGERISRNRIGHGSFAMQIETSRFGTLEVDGSRFITFERGVLGFPDTHEYALVHTSDDSGFYWLQAVNREDLAFVVCDPRLFVPDYRVPVKLEELEPIGLTDADHGQVFIIVNKVDDVLTGNLQGPIVVNVENRQARQLVLSDKRFSTRHPLMRLPQKQEMMKTG